MEYFVLIHTAVCTFSVTTPGSLVFPANTANIILAILSSAPKREAVRMVLVYPSETIYIEGGEVTIFFRRKR